MQNLSSYDTLFNNEYLKGLYNKPTQVGVDVSSAIHNFNSHNSFVHFEPYKVVNIRLNTIPQPGFLMHLSNDWSFDIISEPNGIFRIHNDKFGLYSVGYSFAEFMNDLATDIFVLYDSVVNDSAENISPKLRELKEFLLSTVQLTPR